MAPSAEDLPTLPQKAGPHKGGPENAGPRAAGPHTEGDPTIEPGDHASGKRQRTLGRYRLLFRVARGGMGSVYAAIHESQRGVDCITAIKLLNSQDQSAEEIDAFVQEAKLTASITHRNVLETFELGMDHGELFLVMPLVRGVSLAKVLQAGVPLDPDLAAWIAMQIAAGLHAAHEAKDKDGTPLGVIHRDVSPQNVLLSFDGRVLLVDFGVAKLFEGARATASGVIKGKFGYMAPEQLRGEPLDRRADIFALGIVLFEMLTGRPLYSALPPAQATLRITTDAVPKARDVARSIPEAIDDIVASCLAKDREERFSTALEVRDALRAFLRSRSAVVDETDLATHLASRFAAERADLDERIRAALADRAAPETDATPIEEDDPLPTQASKVVMTSSALPPAKRERGAWPFLLLGGGAIAAAALALGLRGPADSSRASGQASVPAPSSTMSAPAAPPSEPARTTEPASTPAETSEPVASPAPSASATTSASAPQSNATKVPAARPTTSAVAPPATAPATTAAPAKSTDPRGEPFRDL